MRLNADFGKRAVVVPSADAWVISPESGVERLMLDRIGDEVARATSIVRYAPGSSFAPHTHDMGEEFLVLDGVFSDEHGDYGPGTYIRNPPGTAHSPFSEGGCRILVKLRQFDPDDVTPVVVDTGSHDAWADGSDGDSLPLHAFGSERVWMQRLVSGQRLPLEAPPGGIEAFVVKGSATLEETALLVESWLRLPAHDAATLTATADCLLWVKSGHLPA